MRTRISLLIFFILTALTISAQKIEITDSLHTYECHVVSAENNEPLAFVSVYVKQGIGTMTNEEGDFKIKVAPDETLQISYMGYAKVSIKASELPKEIKMKPLEHTLSEVTVMPINSILKKALKVLYIDYKKNKKAQSKYFMRQVTSMTQKELVEAFVQARSTVNLRNIAFITGRHGSLRGNNLGRSLIGSMNFHHELELGPKIYDNPFWKMATTPFGMIEGQGTVETVYNDTLDVLNDAEGNKTYCIALTISPKRTNDYTTLTGTLYIDATNFHLLHFKGKVEGMALDYKKDFVRMTTSTNIDVEINYRYIKGFNEVESIITSFSSGDFVNKSLLFNIDALAQQDGKVTEDEVKKVKGEKYSKISKVGENMLASINDDNFNIVMKENEDFVKRTTEESELADGKTISTEDMMKNHYEVTDGTKKKEWDLELLNTKMGNMVNRLAKVGQSVPQEKVYIHMDNNCYFLGDTIWYSAYLRQTDNDRPSCISGILYVELYNQDGYMMQRQMINMHHGRGHGNFVLNKDWYGGYYELRAYTRWQLNWGVTERPHSEESKRWFINDEMEHRYYRDYEKLYSRVFPVYNAPKKEGKYSKEMTTRELQRKFKKDPDGRTLNLSLYPEGGQAIVGKPCRVAFEATYSNGEYASGKIALKQDASQVLATSINRGRGVFTFTPKTISDINFVFTTTNGKETATATLHPDSVGVALCVKYNNPNWEIETKKIDIKDSLGMTIMHEGRILAFRDIENEADKVVFKNEDLEQGVNQVTIFDQQGRIYAERLFFVTHTDMTNANIRFNGKKELYKPYEKVNLTIEADSTKIAEGENTLSISIHDKDNTDVLYDNASMLTEMLLSSEVRGFIPNPESFFTKDDEEHQRDLDLLMMTQGWRRFNWRQMAVKGEWDLSQPDEPTPVITGKVYNYPSGNFYNTERWDIDIEPTERSHHKEKGKTSMITNEEALDAIYQTIKENQAKSSETIIPQSVIVHSTITSPQNQYKQNLQNNTENGLFRISMPKYKGKYYYGIAASDTTKWSSIESYKWSKDMPTTTKGKNANAEYSLRIFFPYPRFVKPYTCYQQHTLTDKDLGDNNLTTASGKKHNGLSAHRNDSQPALIVDGYEALNYAMDAGMPYSDPYYIMRAYVSDYGSMNPYVETYDSAGQKRAYKEERLEYISGKSLLDGCTTNKDSLYLRENLNTKNVKRYDANWRRLENIDKYVLYTDYQPRLYGSKRYQGDNLPYSYNVIYSLPKDEKRQMYRDRFYVFDGIAQPAEFYSPQYDEMKLPDHPADYRRTLYWNPEIKLDKDGKANITFYNNSKSTQIAIDAEGISDEGVVLHGRE